MTAWPWDQVASIAAARRVSPAPVIEDRSTVTIGASRSTGVVVAPSKTPFRGPSSSPYRVRRSGVTSAANRPVRPGVVGGVAVQPVRVVVVELGGAQDRVGGLGEDGQDVPDGGLPDRCGGRGRRGVGRGVGEGVEGGAEDGGLPVGDGLAAGEGAQGEQGAEAVAADLGVQRRPGLGVEVGHGGGRGVRRPGG